MSAESEEGLDGIAKAKKKAIARPATDLSLSSVFAPRKLKCGQRLIPVLNLLPLAPHGGRSRTDATDVKAPGVKISCMAQPLAFMVMKGRGSMF